MRLNKYTFIFILLAVASNFALSMWLKQGILGVVIAIIFLLIAALTTKRNNIKNQHK
ncbi:hypothetical protein ACFVWC_30085 [Bacillus mycoides]|uniref:hypothetical protein n=1 Tax=Bacillus mycoides TaxID=1405 RepID=UPI0036EF8857